MIEHKSSRAWSLVGLRGLVSGGDVADEEEEEEEKVEEEEEEEEDEVVEG